MVIGKALQLRIGRSCVSGAVDGRIGVASRSAVGNRGRAADRRFLNRDRLEEVIAVSLDILLPDQHGIGRILIWDPVCI